MTVTLTSTDKIIDLKTPSGTVPARVWEGQTESGFAVHAFITRIAVHQNSDHSQFERELLEPHTALSAPLQLVYEGRHLVL